MLSNFVASLLSRRAQVETEAPASDFEVVESPRLMERAFRRPFFRHGALLFEDGQRLNIAVKDLSEGGARVEFYVRTTLPENVMLCEPTLRLRCRAKVVWQIEGAAGLAFIEPQVASSAA
jgi:hypothetical protein